MPENIREYLTEGEQAGSGYRLASPQVRRRRPPDRSWPVRPARVWSSWNIATINPAMTCAG